MTLTAATSPGRCARVIRLLAGVMLVGATLAACSKDEPGRSRMYPVPRSVPSDCSRPVENDLASFLKGVPDGSTVEFADKGCYGLDGSLWITDRNNLTLSGKGSTFKVITTERNTEPYRSNIRVLRGSHITLTDMTIVGACAPTQCQNGTPAHALDGWGQHGINLESTDSPTLDKVHIRDVLSDGVSAQGTLEPDCCWTGAPTSNLVIRNSHIERVGRMLIGITNLDGGLIEDNVIENGPAVGIDLEVDVPTFLARRVRILRNTFRNIHAPAIANGGVGSDPLVGDVLIEGNTLQTDACAGSIWFFTEGPTTPTVYRSKYIVRNNRFQTVGWFLQATRVNDLEIHDNVVDLRSIGCEEKGAVELFDSHRVSIARNTFPGYKVAVWADDQTNAVTSDTKPR